MENYGEEVRWGLICQQPGWMYPTNTPCLSIFSSLQDVVCKKVGFSQRNHMVIELDDGKI